jgi:hypothetical protein
LNFNLLFFAPGISFTAFVNLCPSFPGDALAHSLSWWKFYSYLQQWMMAYCALGMGLVSRDVVMNTEWICGTTAAKDRNN